RPKATFPLKMYWSPRHPSRHDHIPTPTRNGPRTFVTASSDCNPSSETNALTPVPGVSESGSARPHAAQLSAVAGIGGRLPGIATSRPKATTHWPRFSPSSGQVSTTTSPWRSEEHTSELQSRENLVCRLLLEKKKYKSNKK